MNYISSEPRCCKTGVTCTATTTNEEPVEKLKPDSLFIDKRGKLRSFNRKRVSRQKGKEKSIFVLDTYVMNSSGLMLGSSSLDRGLSKGQRMAIWVWFC